MLTAALDMAACRVSGKQARQVCLGTFVDDMTRVG